MGAYETLKTLTLTVEAGSRVIISNEQYQAARQFLVPVSEKTAEPKPLHKMTKPELITLAEEEGIKVIGKMTNAEIIELLEKQV